MTVSEPETITDIKQIVDDCHLVIIIRAQMKMYRLIMYVKEMTTRNIEKILRET